MPSEVKETTPKGICFAENVKDHRQMCKYGKQCYQTNPMHHQKFRHPKENEEDEESKVETGSRRGAEGRNEEKGAAAKKVKTEGRISTEELLNLSNRERIERVYKMSMPEDFYAFWDFCFEQNRVDPWEALVPTYGLRLVGPFELLTCGDNTEQRRSRLFQKESFCIDDLVCNGRHYRDPPEMQTVLASVDDTLHFGYFRDDPKDVPSFVCHADEGKERLHMLGENLFGAMYHHVQKVMPGADPFRQSALNKVKEALHVHAMLKNQFSLEAKTQKMKARDRKSLAPTFHGVGMVVPYDKDTKVGYREIPESTASLRRIFRNVVEAGDDDKAKKDQALDTLQELLTNVQYANDEGDPGMGLELGLDAFVYGGKALEPSIRHLLSVGYELLNRGRFGEIAMAHLARRVEAQPVFRIV